jgi:HK97 family phage prohead protease/HK97 family phage major capsid protein
MTKLLNRYEGRLVSQIKSVKMAGDSEDLIIEGYANTVTKDRAGDVIPKDTWNKAGALNNFAKNPIILAYHDHSKPIGKATDYFVDDMGLNIKAQISKGAGDVYHLIKDGVLSTFSVGFYIKDAEYLSKTDTYMITELELLEVSVVSVPCNQDSTFSVSKSLTGDVEAFKNELLPSSKAENKDSNTDKETRMTTEKKTPENNLTLEAVEKMIADREAAAKAAEEAEKKAAADRKAQADEMKAAAKEAAKDLVLELENKMSESAESFATALKEKQATIEALQDEVRQAVTSRTKSFSYNQVASGVSQEERKSVNDAVLLGIVTQKDTFATKFGSSLKEKAVNTSSSIEVSSEAYETVFSQDLIRDIQAELVIAPIFRDITLNSANLTIPVNPDRKNASWVNSSDFGTNASTGSEISNQLTEITLKTLKLAAKSFITDETSEDAIMPLLPLIRQHLVEAHANEIDRAFLLGNGSGQPKGLVVRATEAEASSDANKAGGVETSAATANGSVAVTAKMILKARKKMKLYGLNVRDVTLVVSTEAYYGLIEDDAWADVNIVGAAATKLNGQVGSIYGMPVLVSDHFEAPAVNKAYAVLVNAKNYVVPTQRNVTVRTDFDVEKDRRVIVATQRLNLESLIRDTDGRDKGVVAVTYAGS